MSTVYTEMVRLSADEIFMKLAGAHTREFV